MKNIFKLSNKVLMTALLTGLLSSVSSAGLEARTFYSADMSKSFKGTLTGFYQDKKQVRVRTAKGKDLSFKLGVLSKECQDYIAKNASKVAVASSLNISFEQVKGEKVKGKDGVDNSFNVTFLNKSKTALQDVEIDYTVFYKKGNITKGAKSAEMTSTGTFNVSELDPNYRTTMSTAPIEIVRKSIKSKGGG